MTTSLDMIRGRSNIVTMTNNSGGTLIAGDVCVQDATGDEYVTTTTIAASTSKVFIAAESIGIGASGKFYESGYCPYVQPNASATRGYFLFTHTVAKQATSASGYAAGAFGRVLKAGTTPSAIIYSATAQVAGGGTIGGSSGSTDNAVIRADGTGGSTIQSSLATIDDSGGINIPTGQTYNINNSPHTHAASSGMVKIATLGSGASFDFTAIPGTYTDLKIIVQARGDTVAVGTAVHIHFNGDAAGNYDSEVMDVNNTTVTASPQIGTAANFIGGIAAASATANQIGCIEITIPNYAGTTFYKTYIGTGGNNQGQSAGTQFMRICQGQWRNTAAITQVTLVPGAGNFAAGSTATLYGMG